MKKLTHAICTLSVALAATTFSSHAALNIPSDGSDGAFAPTDNIVVDLGQAVTGTWDANNSANVGKGIYDPEKWAVVFKYSSVNIPAGKTVTFKNHPSRAPVVWLVQGDVTISGQLLLNGETVGYNAPALAEPGPGGFRGGQGYFAFGVAHGSGFGPGGGAGGNYGVGGSYGSVGSAGPAVYGNPSLIPLIGGSGGGGYSGDQRGGGGGGGAILIAAAGTLEIAGTLSANGGGAAGGNGGGSGGGVRLLAGNLSGNGVVRCLGGNSSNPGGVGRIRLERVSASGTLQLNPDPSVLPLQDGATPLIWPPADAPSVRVVSVGEVVPASDPRAAFGASGPDVTLPQTSTTPVVVETTNVENASVVRVRVTPRSNGNYTETVASLTEVVSTDPLVIRWTANVPVNAGYSAMQVKVVRP